MTTSLITLPKAVNAPAQSVIDRKDTFLSVVPSANIDPQLWLASLVIELNQITKNCTPLSVNVAALNAAYLGLQFGKQLGHVYLVPFKNGALTKRNNADTYDLTLVVGYQGFRHLAFGTGFLKTLHTDVVCRGEEFRQWTDENGPHFHHVPADDRNPSRDNITHAYCQFSTMADGKGCRIVPRSEINKSDKQADVWNSNYPAMCLKTGIRKTAKLWNLTSRMSHAVYIDEQAERDESQAPPPGIESDEAPQAQAGYSLPTGEKTNGNSNESLTAINAGLPTVPWWFSGIDERKDSGAVNRFHTTFDGVRDQYSRDDQDAIEGKFSARLESFATQTK